MKKSLLFLLSIGGLYLLNGCGSSTPPPPVATHFSVTSASATPTAGTPFNITVTALDKSGQMVANYSGTVQFTSSNGKAVQPASGTLASGTGTFSVTLNTAGSQTITATDAASLTGTSNSIMVSIATSHFSVTVPANATTGIAFNITVSALDATSSVVTGYSGKVHFTSSDGQATLPVDSTLANGAGNFTVTFKTIGSQTITTTDTVTASLKATSSAISVVSNAPTHLAFNGISGSVTTRQSFNFTVNALDAANNVAVGYGGTVKFSSSDAQAMLPANTTLTSGVSGSVTATFETAGSGSQTITATDTVANAVAGSATVAVSTVKTLGITSSAPPDGTVGDLYDPHTVTGCLGNPICTPVQVLVHGFPLTGQGGVLPYTWNWAAASGSSLPPGLTIYDAGNIACGAFHAPRPLCISGTPTQPGTFKVVVIVTDSGTPSAQSSTPYSITINKPAAPSVGGVPTPAVENQPYTFAFSASGYPPLTWSESGALPSGLTFNDSNGTLSGTPTQTGSFPISITATDQFGQSSQPADVPLVVDAHGFVPAGNMTTPRALHTSTLLNGGMVLITGGANYGNPPTVTASAELYNPSNGTFSATVNMQAPRVQHTATLLNDGRVLVAGGASIVLTGPWASAEVFDPTGATSTATGSMKTARFAHTATLLANGKVLMTGGADATSTAMVSAELFDPTTNTFSTTGSLQTARKEHTATLLANGKVLVTGGIDDKSNDLDSAELYDPTTGTFTQVVGTMTAARAGHTATLFATGADAGKVLLAGGVDATGKALNTAELFDPGAQSFTATNNMTSAHAYHTATLLSGGTVLLAGGVDATGGATSVAELFDPSSGNFSRTGSLILAREQHAATLLSNGQVLATGGQNGGSISSIVSAEIYK